MAEALEKWPIELFSKLLPRIYQIVEEINRRFCETVRAKYPEQAEEKIAKMAIIYDGQVKMAHLAIIGGHAVNGVAALHTEILKKQELRDFYEMYPEKFSNKTNGITQRRWVYHANPELAKWITAHIGDQWLTDLSKLEKLAVYADDKQAQAEFMAIKRHNKERLAKYVLKHNGIKLNVDSIFDVMVKRLHEYKRQLMNILHVMYLYNQIKDHPEMEFYPHTFIFGAKAAAGYKTAKLTIKLINNVAEVINNDPSIQDKIKVVFIEDYKVSSAEVIIPAADFSEQISTASKEASGTSNMKLMVNGALTMGTMDGANVEIVQEVGAENAFIFGMSSDEVIALEHNNEYRPMDIFNNDQEIRRVLMQLVNGFYSPEDPELFRPLYDSLLNTNESDRADRYFILKDLRAYMKAQEEAVKKFQDEEWWARAAILNTAHAGKFSSDRTIEEYAKDIWGLDKIVFKD
jgi:phosphorylase, glycogen/starch/alpha-glucan family